MATPRDSKGNRMSTRASSYKQGDPLPLPKVGAGGSLVALFHRLGASFSTAAGECPWPPSELVAWQTGARVRLLPFEFEALIDMSRAYCAGKAEGENPNAPSPVIVRVATPKRIKSILRS